VASGLILCSATFYLWAQTKFGALDPTLTMRFFIPGITMLTIGVETMFASFFLSILGLNRR
jgi:hypothetical protein